MIPAIGGVILGLIALVVGGEWLIRGAVRLAERIGVSPLMIGIVIVGCGTSLPELVACVEAALLGAPDIAWGNVAGSNIANVLLILGAVALINPLRLGADNGLRDPLVGLAASAFLLAACIMGWAHWLLGGAMLAALAVYIAWCYQQEKAIAPAVLHNAPHDRAELHELADRGLHGTPGALWQPVLLTLVGLAVLLGGGKLLVGGAIDIARIVGLSETLLGLTVVAIGTSLPELATALIAARKGETALAFGSVVGSNIYNILGIGGATMLIAPGAIPGNLWPASLGMLLASAALLVIVASLLRGIGRLIGAGLLLSYMSYLIYLAVNI